MSTSRDALGALQDAQAENAALRAVVAGIRAARSNHPACSRHPLDDAVTCGWKMTVLDIDAALSHIPEHNNTNVFPEPRQDTQVFGALRNNTKEEA